MAQSRRDNEGGAGPCGPQEGQISTETQSEAPELTNAELVQLRVPVMHILGLNKIDPAKHTPGARVQPDGTLVYPAAEEEVVKE